MVGVSPAMRQQSPPTPVALIETAAFVLGVVRGNDFPNFPRAEPHFQMSWIQATGDPFLPVMPCFRVNFHTQLLCSSSLYWPFWELHPWTSWRAGRKPAWRGEKKLFPDIRLEHLRGVKSRRCLGTRSCESEERGGCMWGSFRIIEDFIRIVKTVPNYLLVSEYVGELGGGAPHPFGGCQEGRRP